MEKTNIKINDAMETIMLTREMEKSPHKEEKNYETIKNGSDFGVVYKKKQVLTLCIRGTGGESGFIKSLQGWIRNFMFRKKKAKNFYSAKHRGFKQSSLFFTKRLISELKKDNSIKEIELIGFSAGGGIVQCMLSQIVKDILKRKGILPVVSIYLFASPNAISDPFKLPFYPRLRVYNIRNEGDFIAGIGHPLYKDFGEIIEMETSLKDKLRGISWVHHYDCYLRNTQRRLKNGK